MNRHAGWLILTLCLAALLIYPTDPAPSAPAPHCRTEDELLLEVVDPGYDHEPGDLVCVHIDAIYPTIGGTP